MWRLLSSLWAALRGRSPASASQPAQVPHEPAAPSAGADTIILSDGPPTLPPGPPTIVDTVGGYRILGLLGRGPMTEVFRALSPEGQEVALRRIGFPFGEVPNPEAGIEVCHPLRHPFLLRTLAFIRGADHLVYVTELAEGSLQDWFDRCRREGQPGIPVIALLNFLGDAAEALDYLHTHHVRHRQLKPSNLLLLGGRARVADVQPLRTPDPEEPVVEAPLYWAPEELQNQGSYRSNQYALALIYLHMRTGQLAVPGGSIIDMIIRRLANETDLQGLPEVERPPVARALSVNPENRFGTCKEFIDALKAAVSPQCRPSGWREPLDPAWLTWNDGCVARIAQAIENEGRFGDMPILADALEDAGCTDPVVLDHCRQVGEHVRGCFVVDMLTRRRDH